MPDSFFRECFSNLKPRIAVFLFIKVDFLFKHI